MGQSPLMRFTLGSAWWGVGRHPKGVFHCQCSWRKGRWAGPLVSRSGLSLRGCVEMGRTRAGNLSFQTCSPVCRGCGLRSASWPPRGPFCVCNTCLARPRGLVRISGNELQASSPAPPQCPWLEKVVGRRTITRHPHFSASGCKPDGEVLCRLLCGWLTV